LISDGNLAVSALTASQGSCTPTLGNITCAIGAMNSGAKVNISFALTMGPSEAVSNNFSLSSDTPDLSTADNNLALNVNVNPVDLTVSQSASPNPTNANTQVMYTISVKNKGPAAATNVVLNDTLPSGTTIGSAQASQGTCSAPANGVLSCALGSLAAAANATVSFGATPNSGGTMTNTVSATSDQFDLVPADNSTSLDVAAQDFSITTQSADLTLTRGGSVSEVLTFEAQGGLTSNLDLKCAVSGPAAAPTCGVSPSTVAAGSTATLTVSSPSSAASLAPDSQPQLFRVGILGYGLPFAALGLLAARRTSKNRRRLLLLCALITIAGISAACGNSTPPPPQSYTVTVTATATPNGIQHTTSIHVTLK
jgi:uncharacterized repeat protein (TIGR01451 family)